MALVERGGGSDDSGTAPTKAAFATVPLLAALNRDVGFKCAVMGFALLEAAALILINRFGAQLDGLNFIYPWLPFALVVAFAAYAATLKHRTQHPRLALFVQTVWAGLNVMTLTVMLDTAVELTPFPPIDEWILHIDQAMGYSTLAVLNWTNAHPGVRDFLNIVYHALDVELAVAPLVLALLIERRTLNMLLNGVMFGSVIGFTIYYFFPTNGPAGVLESSGFTLEEDDIVRQFRELHSGEALTSAVPGLVSFPSFHVFWAIVITTAFWPRKWWFFPVAVLNGLVIISTLALGWHYLFDVFGGVALALLSIPVGFLTTAQREKARQRTS